jgi:hypothetical protein
MLNPAPFTDYSKPEVNRFFNLKKGFHAKLRHRSCHRNQRLSLKIVPLPKAPPIEVVP